MRFLLAFLVLLIVFVGSSQAQDFEPFQLYLTSGPQRALSYGDVGGTFTVEPAHRLDDNISMGLRIQGGFFSRIVEATIQDRTYSFVQVANTFSWGVSAKYYFTNTSFRPYVGLGAGLYILISADGDRPRGISVSGGPTRGNSIRKLLVYPRIGFDWRHFNINVDVNLVPKSDVELEDYTVNSDLEAVALVNTAHVQNSHVAFTLGFFLFGGKRG